VVARGGYRPGSGAPRGVGRPKGSKNGTSAKAADRKAILEAKKLPLAYMLEVMNDPEVDIVRRDRMAQAAAPYCHPRKADAPATKREDAEEKAAASRFEPMATPKLVISNE
jgi:hypothetical protein